MDTRPDAIYRALQLDLAPYLSSRPPVEVNQDGLPSYVPVAAAAHLLDNVLKKYVVSSESADKTAADTFLASNKKCKGWVSPYLRSDLSESDMILVNQFQKVFEDFFLNDLGPDCELSWGNVCEGAYSGPGSSIGARGFSMYAKHFSSPLTATSNSLVRIYQAHCRMYPEWSNAEIIRQLDWGSPRLCSGSRSSFAPKTARTSRMICVEPTVNMYLQLGLGSLIEKRLKRFFGIDFAIQPSINRCMAKQSSERPNGGSTATVDLRSASDSISLQFLGVFVPMEWQSAILELRSRQTALMGKMVDLEMVSTMGNGFTFPFQTAIFSSAVVACLSLDSNSQTNYSDVVRCWSPDFPSGGWSVFGDDIVIRTDHYERLARLLAILGFEVNSDKSFATGPFRESCGHDYYHGTNIRPVYVRRIKTDQDVAVLVNLFNEWSTRTGIILPHLMGTLWSFFRKKPHLVPFDENMDAGVRVPWSLISTVAGKQRPTRSRRFQSTVYNRWQSRAPKVRIGDGTINVPRGQRRLAYNPPGLLQSYLHGEIRGGEISTRFNGPLPYDTKRAVTPYWDYQRKSADSEIFRLRFDKALWDIVTVCNIGHHVCSSSSTTK